MSIDKLLLWEKYRPKTMKQMILIPRISTIVESGIISNMVFYGSSGTGKSSLAWVLANECNALLLNGKLGIEILTSKIENHFKSLNFEHKDELKLVVIDEFDRASTALQDGLKSFIEEYPNARFIFTTNHINNITDELLSRFIKIPFDPINSDEREFLFKKQVNYLRAVSKKEGHELYKEIAPFEQIMRKEYPDLRSAVEFLHLVMVTGELSIVTTEYGSTKNDLFSFIMDGNLDPIIVYDYIMNNFFITFDDAFKYLSRPFIDYLKETHTQTLIKKGAMILKKQKEYNETLNVTLDPLVHLVNYVLDLKTVLSQ